MKMKLMIYDLNVNYLSGKLMFIANLSKNYLSDLEAEEEIKGVTHTMDCKNINIEIISEATENDDDLREVINVYNKGWPTEKKCT